MKSFKKLICIISALVIVMIAVVPSFAVDIRDLTYLYLDKGNIVIGDNTVLGYGYFGQKVTAVNENGYCITFSNSSITTTTNTVVVNGGENHITFDSLNINVSTNDFACAVSVQNGAKLDVFFTGTNTFVSSAARAGFEISSDSEVTFGGDGTLKCGSNGQAGIGGGGGGSNGTVIINSGTIVAQCGRDNAAGIGGGSSGSGGTIIINGGSITAKAGRYGAGIGGGSTAEGGNITINGGTVTATAGENAAGIGGGWYGQMGTVIINGGSVKAIPGTGAPAIGAGNGLQTDGSVVNSDGTAVYRFAVSSIPYLDNDFVYVNGEKNYVCGSHPDDYNYYFYAPLGTCFIAADSGTIYKTSISASGSSSLEIVNPIRAKNGASIGDDDIIRGISCGLTDLNDYLWVDSGYSLSYDNDYIGTGTAVTLMYGNSPVFKYRTLLYGDVNNDGFYDAEDSIIVVCILCNMLNRDNTDAIIFEAADADRNGVISAEDVRLLEQAGILLGTVPQTDGVLTLDTDAFEEYICIVDQTYANEPAQESSEPVSEAVTVSEKNVSLIDFIKNFIKNAIKLFSYVRSFWKNYFI